MADKENIRKALEMIAGENKIDMGTPEKLYATHKKPKEIETEGGLFKVRAYGRGKIEIESLLGPRINITPVHLDETTKATCPKGAVYKITTCFETKEGYYTLQNGICYIDAKGLVILSESNIRINREMNMK